MWKLEENCLKVDFHKNDTEKLEKTVFFAFFDILVSTTPEGRFQPKYAKNLIFMNLELNSATKISITR